MLLRAANQRGFQDIYSEPQTIAAAAAAAVVPVVTSNLSMVVVAAAAVAAAAAESAFTKLLSRPLLSRGWVGVLVGLGGMLPVRTLKLCVARFRFDTFNGLGGAESQLA